jgi:hypothetical protein
MQIKPREIYDGRSRGKQRDPWQKMETGDERPKENTGISMETQESEEIQGDRRWQIQRDPWKIQGIQGKYGRFILDIRDP